MILFHWVSSRLLILIYINIDINHLTTTVLYSDRTTMVTGNLEVHYLPEKATHELPPKRPSEVTRLNQIKHNSI